MTAPLEDEEFTLLYDADLPRVDLVSRAANGTRFLIAKQDGAAGLLEPDFVRKLITKAGPDSGRERVQMSNGITVSGSAADIAAFIHKAAVRAQEREGAVTVEVGGGACLTPEDAAAIADRATARLAKAEMSSKSINDLPDSAFGYIEPGGKKDESGRTVPRSLRHFPLNDAAHVRNALSRAPQSPFGDKAMPKIRARAKELGIDVAKEAAMAAAVAKDMGPDLDDGVDGLDPTVPLCEPDEMGPGDPTDPGSPAWESIDAASASKWTSIFARGKNALSVLAEREMLEAASADPDDACNAMDLQDAMCALDFVIGILAPFAVGEQSQADCGAAEMAAIGKAAAAADGPLTVIEGLAAVAKSGRVLSAANEAAIRAAAESLQKVLASLPEAPVAKQAEPKEGTVAGTQTAGNAPATPVAKEDAGASPEAQAADAGPVDAGGTTGMGEPRETGPAAALPGDGPQKKLPGDVPGRQVIKSALALVYDRDRNLVGVTDATAIVQRVVKADGDGEKKAMQAVFDQDGDLIGIVDPDAIQPVTGAGGKQPTGDDGEAQPGPAAAAADDTTPQPPADAGTPAEGVAKGGTTDVITLSRDVLKAVAEEAARTALDAQGAAHAEVVAKMAADKGELAEELRVVKERLATVEASPAAPKVFTNGQVPPAHQLRGQDQGGAAHVDVAKAQETRRQFLNADPAEQNRLAGEMQQGAIATLAAIHGRQ